MEATIGGKSKSKQKTDNSLDPWSKANYDRITGDVRGILSNNPYQSYGGERVAGISDMERSAMSGYGATVGQPNSILQGAMDTAGQAYTGGPQSIEARSFKNFDADPYMNPYEDQVVDRVLGDMDRARRIAISDTEGQVHSSAFGGARHGVSDALTNERFIDQAGNAAASLRQQGYNQAQNLYGSDMDRAMATDQFNVNQQNVYDQGLLARAGLTAGMAGQYGDQAAREAQMQTMLGTNQRAIGQAELDANYAEFLRGQEDPYKRAAIMMGLLSGTPMIQDGTSTGTQSTTPGIAGILGAGASVAGGLGWSPFD